MTNFEKFCVSLLVLFLGTVVGQLSLEGRSWVQDRILEERAEYNAKAKAIVEQFPQLEKMYTAFWFDRNIGFWELRELEEAAKEITINGAVK